MAIDARDSDSAFTPYIPSFSANQLLCADDLNQLSQLIIWERSQILKTFYAGGGICCDSNGIPIVEFRWDAETHELSLLKAKIITPSGGILEVTTPLTISLNTFLPVLSSSSLYLALGESKSPLPEVEEVTENGIFYSSKGIALTPHLEISKGPNPLNSLAILNISYGSDRLVKISLETSHLIYPLNFSPFSESLRKEISEDIYFIENKLAKLCEKYSLPSFSGIPLLKMLHAYIKTKPFPLSASQFLLAELSQEIAVNTRMFIQKINQENTAHANQFIIQLFTQLIEKLEQIHYQKEQSFHFQSSIIRDIADCLGKIDAESDERFDISYAAKYYLSVNQDLPLNPAAPMVVGNRPFKFYQTLLFSELAKFNTSKDQFVNRVVSSKYGNHATFQHQGVFGNPITIEHTLKMNCQLRESLLFTLPILYRSGGREREEMMFPRLYLNGKEIPPITSSNLPQNGHWMNIMYSVSKEMMMPGENNLKWQLTGGGGLFCAHIYYH